MERHPAINKAAVLSKWCQISSERCSHIQPTYKEERTNSPECGPATPVFEQDWFRKVQQARLATNVWTVQQQPLLPYPGIPSGLVYINPLHQATETSAIFPKISSSPPCVARSNLHMHPLRHDIFTHLSCSIPGGSSSPPCAGLPVGRRSSSSGFGNGGRIKCMQVII